MGERDRCEDQVKFIQLFGGDILRCQHCEGRGRIDNAPQLHLHKAGGDPAGGIDGRDAEFFLHAELALCQHYAEIGREESLLVLRDGKVVFARDHFAGNAGHLECEGILFADIFPHGIGEFDPKAHAVDHEHQVIEKFFCKIAHLNTQIEIDADLLVDLGKERPYGLVKLDRAHALDIRRRPHSDHGQQSE